MSKCNASLLKTAFFRLTGLAALLLGMAVPVWGQTVTWVLPSDEKPLGLELKSVAPDVRLEVIYGEIKGNRGKTKTSWERSGESVASVTELGWHYEDFELGPTLTARGSGWSDTRPVKLVVSGLPPGQHKVVMRYWSQARRDQGYSVLRLGLGDEKRMTWGKWNTWERFDEMALVAGLGGYEGGLFDATLGVVGSKENPATKVIARFDRYRWGNIARFGGLRIETTPDPDAARTAAGQLRPGEKRVRDALLANGRKRFRGSGTLGFATVPSSAKVRPKSFASLVEPAELSLKDHFDLAGAGGERVNGQMVVFSPEADFEVASLEVTELSKADGERLRAEDTLFAPVGYLLKDTAYDLDAYGWWPDPIFAHLQEDFTVGRGDVQSFWLRFHVPRDAAPGVYTGNARITEKNGAVLSVPIGLRVFGFSLPEAFSLRTAVSTTFVEENSENGENFVLAYGLNPAGIYSSSPPTAEDLRRWAKDGRVNAFNLRYVSTGYIDGLDAGKPNKAELDALLDQIGRTLDEAEAVGLRDEAYFYMFDEVKKDGLPAMKAFSEAVGERFPDLLTLTTAHPLGSHGNFVELPGIRGWTPRIPGYDPQKAEEARERFGREVWWYTANAPRPPYPNLMVTQPAMAHRLLMGFMAIGYQTDGYLLWRADRNWRKGKYPGVGDDLYVSPGDWPLEEHGQFIPRGPDGPLPSIRLETFRDGLEDYEYLVRTHSILEEVPEAELSDEYREHLPGIRSFFEPGNRLVRSFGDFSHDPGELEAVRRAFGTFIEKHQPDGH